MDMPHHSPCGYAWYHEVPMYVSLAPPLWKKTAILPTSAHFMISSHSPGRSPPRPMLCLISVCGCLPLMSWSLV